MRAVELQPLNWAAWYELGRFDQEVLGDDIAAARELQAGDRARPARLSGAPSPRPSLQGGKLREVLLNLGG